MNISFQESQKVIVKSKFTLACKIAQNILKNQGIVFQYQTIRNSNQLNSKIQYLIIDENHIQKIDKNLFTNNHVIILKDTQKSTASIFALSGQLSTFGQNQKQQFVPKYILDFIIGISLSLLILQMKVSNNFTTNIDVKNRIKHHKQISLIDLVKYFGAFNISAKQNHMLLNSLGKNQLDGGAPFYDLYKCKQGTLAVGNLQPKFYEQMIKGLKLQKQKQDYMLQIQLIVDDWPKMKQILTQQFLKKSAQQWQKIMQNYDTCITEVKKQSKSKQFQSNIYDLVKPKL